MKSLQKYLGLIKADENLNIKTAARAARIVCTGEDMLIDLKVGQNFTAVVLIDKIVKKPPATIRPMWIW